MNQVLWIVSLLYGIMGILYAFIGIRRIVRRNEIEIFDFCSIDVIPLPMDLFYFDLWTEIFRTKETCIF